MEAFDADADADAVKERSRQLWGTGDYRPTGRLLEPVSAELVAKCALSTGDRVLDVAAGDGNCSLAAARAGARVVASDFTPKMLKAGARRTGAEGFDGRIRWQHGDAEDLPFEDGSFDCVTSVFGAVFAPRQDVVAAELARVVRHGETIGLAAWPKSSFAASLVEVLTRRLPPPPATAPDPFDWGDRTRASELLEGKVSSTDYFVQSVDFHFESFASMRATYEAHGLVALAKQQMSPDDYEAMFADLEALVPEWNVASGTRIAIPNRYLLIVARR